MGDHPKDSFWAMEELLKRWLDGARDQEIWRVLDLVREELRRRGYELVYEVRPRRPEKG